MKNAPPLLLNVNSIIPVSRVNGPGFRFVIFAQGCPIHCPGCWNKATWDMAAKATLSVEEVFSQILAVRDQIAGVTFLGGEPFSQAQALAVLGRLCREAGLSVITYTGFTFEFLQSEKAPKGAAELLAVTDTLIDGPFVKRLQVAGLVWKGSTNQRIMHLTEKLVAVFAVQPEIQFEFHLNQDGATAFTADQPAIIPDFSRLTADLAAMGVELEPEILHGGSK